MPCYRPLKAFKTLSGAVVFSEVRTKGDFHEIELACGRCVGCRLERSRQWATRCTHEASLWEHNCFITLTYDDDHLPSKYFWGWDERGNRVYAGTLLYYDFQRFIRRLRKALGRGGAFLSLPHDYAHTPVRSHGAPPHTPIRFYMGAEYGERYDRPHYHACMFNLQFSDLRKFKEERGNTLYTSDTLTKLWGKGHCTVGELTFESAAYTARYIMKKQTGDNAKLHYKRIDRETGEIIQLTPEFNKMSLKPGIGAEWIQKYHRDVYPHGKVITRGFESNPPKYYDKLLKRNSPDEHDAVKTDRETEAYAKRNDNTEQRLKAKETVAKAKLNQKKRGLE